MRTKSILCYFMLICITGLFSCQNDNDDSNIFVEKIEVEGEGGLLEIPVDMDNWKITGVKNKYGNMNVVGDIYTPEGEKIKENEKLELDGLGSLEANWDNKGFRIIRDAVNSLKIKVMENFTDEEFSFGVIIQNEGQFKEIVINQKISEGYRLGNIEYSLKEGDGDSLYVKKGNISYKLTFSEPTDFTLSPYSSELFYNTSYFESDFKWYQEESLIVKVPSSIDNGDVYIYNEERNYGEITQIRYEGVN